MSMFNKINLETHVLGLYIAVAHVTYNMAGR